MRMKVQEQTPAAHLRSRTGCRRYMCQEAGVGGHSHWFHSFSHSDTSRSHLNKVRHLKGEAWIWMTPVSAGVGPRVSGGSFHIRADARRRTITTRFSRRAEGRHRGGKGHMAACTVGCSSAPTELQPDFGLRSESESEETSETSSSCRNSKSHQEFDLFIKCLWLLKKIWFLMTWNKQKTSFYIYRFILV